MPPARRRRTDYVHALLTRVRPSGSAAQNMRRRTPWSDSPGRVHFFSAARSLAACWLAAVALLDRPTFW